MRARASALAAVAWVTCSAWAASSGAQARVTPRPLPVPVADAPSAPLAPEAGPGLRATLGTEKVLQLLRSASDDDVVRGIRRLAAMDTPEATALLVRAAAPSPGAAGDGVTGCARRNPKALLGVVRGLAPHADRDPARKALLDVVDGPLQQLDVGAASPPAASDPEGAPVRAARVLLARQEAALAVAATGSTTAAEKLVDIARKEGPGEAAAVAALAAHPPQSPLVLGGVTLTTRSMIGLAATTGDLRTLDATLGVLKASDAGLRAAAFTALGEAGDARVLGAARDATHDPSAKVRVAAAGALVHLGVADAGAAVEALVADDATAMEGLRLAAEVQGEGVTRAAAARAAASADRALRTAAVEALGRQTSPAAVTALVALGRDPGLRGDAVEALARSPSAAATAAIEAMATQAGDARMAGRAYFVRRFVRGTRSRALDELLARLASAAAGPDRVVGLEALVALGERPVEAGLADPDPRVRAAVAMGAGARLDARTSRALLAQRAVEKDAATRTVLGIGLAGGDERGVLPESRLRECLQSGGPDAPLAALALARRSTAPVPADVAALLASHDPVIRAHAARGFGASEAPDAAGLLAEAYEVEVDATVRRAILDAIASRPRPIGPGADAAIALAAQLDPDAEIRAVAARALQGEPQARSEKIPEVAWLSLVPAEGATLPPASTATLVDAGGLAVPIAFDDDGLALEPGVPPGAYRLRLAPRMPPYSPSTP